MKFTRKEALATALVIAILIPYVGYAIGGSMPLVADARGMGATGLIFGLAAWLTLGPDAFGPRWLGVGGALVAAALGGRMASSWQASASASAALETALPMAWPTSVSETPASVSSSSVCSLSLSASAAIRSAASAHLSVVCVMPPAWDGVAALDRVVRPSLLPGPPCPGTFAPGDARPWVRRSGT